MIAVYSDSPIDLGATLSALADRMRVSRAESWTEFEQLAMHADYCVAVISPLTRSVCRRLRQLKIQHPVTPLVLVTGKDFDNALHLKDISVEEVVWRGEEYVELWAAIQRADRSSLSCLADVIEMSGHLPVNLRRALSHACRQERPVTSIESLTLAAGCSRSTLNMEWRRAVTREPHLRLEDFVDWIFFLKVVVKRQPGRSWESIANDFGTYQSVLSRLARRLTGHTLRVIAHSGARLALSQFQTQVLGPLLRE